MFSLGPCGSCIAQFRTVHWRAFVLGPLLFWGAEMRFAGAEKCIFVILTRSDFGVWALQGVSRLSLVWQGSGTESHGSLWALATGSRLVDRARVRRICGFWKHCLHRAFSLARRPSAFSEPLQTHLLWERCVSLGTCSIAFLRGTCRGAFRGARKTHRTPSRYGSTRSRVQGLQARKTHVCRGAFGGVQKTHRPPFALWFHPEQVQGL